MGLWNPDTTEALHELLVDVRCNMAARTIAKWPVEKEPGKLSFALLNLNFFPSAGSFSLPAAKSQSQSRSCVAGSRKGVCWGNGAGLHPFSTQTVNLRA